MRGAQTLAIGRELPQRCPIDVQKARRSLQPSLDGNIDVPRRQRHHRCSDFSMHLLERELLLDRLSGLLARKRIAKDFGYQMQSVQQMLRPLALASKHRERQSAHNRAAGTERNPYARPTSVFKP